MIMLLPLPCAITHHPAEGVGLPLKIKNIAAWAAIGLALGLLAGFSVWSAVSPT
jgi:hypothetical protein